MIKLWREYTPQLRSEGTPENKIPYVVISCGLSGLQMEVYNDSQWIDKLNEREAGLACRYACFGLNNFPDWFHSIFSKYPKVVCDTLCREIQHELSTETDDSKYNYILYIVSHTEWLWNNMAPHCYSMLERSDPVNISSLECLLAIVQGSSISDEELSQLVNSKAISSVPSNSAARWLAVLAGIDPDKALSEFEDYIGSISKMIERTDFEEQFFISLLGSNHSIATTSRNAFHKPEYLKRIYLLMHEYISVHEDINRANEGELSPILRDDAQYAYGRIVKILSNIPGKAAFDAFLEISDAHSSDSYKAWFSMAKDRAEMDADITAWTPGQVLDFHTKLEKTPTNHRDLAELVHFRLLDLKDDLENGDSSIAETLKLIKKETEMRKFLGREFREKAFGRYNITQEEELADDKKPDFRFHGIGFDGPIPAELKLADKWSGPKLLERLENQLCGDYLRDTNSTRGFFILVNQGNKDHWKPSITLKCNFDELICALQEHWKSLASKFPDIDIEIIGIDLTARSKKRAML